MNTCKNHVVKIYEACIAEIDAVFGTSSRPANMADLEKLEYLEACIKEALRKFPSVPAFARQIDKDLEVAQKNGKKCTIPKNTIFAMHPYFLHRNEDHWPEPEKFDPQRFVKGAAGSRYAYSYIPFSAGPRNCIGQRFALLEEKIMISAILRKFHIRALRRTEDIEVSPEIILRAEGGIKLHLQPRNIF